VVLCNISHQKAVEYLMQHFNDITSMDAMMQSAVIKFIQKDASLDPAHKVFQDDTKLTVASISSLDFRFA
jgi:hypothetical protein